jgi:hypothetical protein
MLRSEGFHAVRDKQKLEIHRLLRPERAIVVEYGDAFRGPHESGELSFVTRSTKLMIAFFGAVSFQDGSGLSAMHVAWSDASMTTTSMNAHRITFSLLCLLAGEIHPHLCSLSSMASPDTSTRTFFTVR